jgi:Rap1a immunity proteins
MKRFIAAAALLLAAPPAHGMDGNELLSMCTGKQFGTCLGYIEAAWDAAVNTDMACPPERPRVTAAQAKDLVVSVLKTVPELRNQSALALAMETFQTAFPCGKPL